MKTAAGLAFTALDETNSRVGFHTHLGQQAAVHRTSCLSTTANKSDVVQRFLQLAPSGGTPLPDAMWRIGELFSNPSTTGWTNTTGISGATDPLDPATGACQDNFHLLSTDGYWNCTRAAHVVARPGQRIGAADAGQDGSDPVCIRYESADRQFTPGSQFPRGYCEGPTAVSNNLADLAMKYWINDIRKDFANGSRTKVPGDFPWQHVTFYGLSIGAQGTIRYTGNGDRRPRRHHRRHRELAFVAEATAQPVRGRHNAGPEAIDDLWHAGINCRGRLRQRQEPAGSWPRRSSASWPTSSIQRGTGTGSRDRRRAVQPGQPVRLQDEATTLNDPIKDWSGDVKKYLLDLATGVAADRRERQSDRVGRPRRNWTRRRRRRQRSSAGTSIAGS